MNIILHKISKLGFLFVLLFAHQILLAQVPQKMSYQAVVRNTSNILVTATQVKMRISILQGSATGTSVYSEIQNPITNTNGLVSLEIGTGTIVSGTFAAINWGTGNYYIKTETDPTGGTNYSIVGASQLLSVPYALYSANGPQGPAGTFPTGTNVGDMQYWNGTSWVMIPIGQPGQTLKITPTNIPQWSQSILSTVTTDSVADVMALQVTLTGTVSNSGTELVLSRGFCYATTANPTVSNSLITSGSGLGVFTESPTDLLPSTLYHVRAFSTTIAGTTYGADLTFTTLSGIAVLTTTPATDIIGCQAISGGTISTDGGAPITASGVCFGTNPNPTILDNFVDGDGQISFVATLNITNPNTLYYYRAFATNGVNTYYGNQLGFTSENISVVLSPASVSNITNCGVAISSTAVSSSSTSLSYGFVYGLSSNPTVDSQGVSVVGANTTGTTSVNLSTTISCLLPNTTYFVRAFSQNCSVTTYGNQSSFTTPISNISVFTNTPVNLNSCNLNVYTNNNPSNSCVSGYRITFGESSNPTGSGISVSYYDYSNELGYFYLYNLTPNKTYYYHTYAQLCDGTVVHGNEVNVTTLSKYTSFVTNPVTNITAGTAILNGLFIGNNVNSLECGFVYGTSPNPTLETTNNIYFTSALNHSQTIRNLTSNTTYYVRAFVRGETNCVPIEYGNQVTFTTAATPFVIGQNHDGGIIFWVNSIGTGGLIAAITDQNIAPWGCEGTNIVGTNTSIGSGQANTNAILAGCGFVTTAAKVCNDLVLNGKSDWYLPSEAELVAIGNLNFFNFGNYWSSTQVNSSKAKFVNGTISSEANKSEANYRVRAIRSF